MPGLINLGRTYTTHLRVVVLFKKDKLVYFAIMRSDWGVSYRDLFVLVKSLLLITRAHKFECDMFIKRLWFEG